MIYKTKELEEEDRARRYQYLQRYEEAKASGYTLNGNERFLYPLLKDGRSLEAIAKKLEELGPKHFDQTLEFLRTCHHYEFLALRILHAAVLTPSIPTAFIAIHLARITNGFNKVFGISKYERGARAAVKLALELYHRRNSKLIFMDRNRMYRMAINLPEPLLVTVLDILKKENMRLGDHAFLKFVARLCKTERYFLVAYNMLMERQAYITDKLPVIIETYASCLSTLLKHGYWDEGIALVESLRRHGLPPGRAVYNVLLLYSANMADAEKVQSIYSSFLDAGLRPCMFTLTALYTFESKRGNKDGAEAVIQTMREKMGRISPHVFQNRIKRLQKLLWRDEMDFGQVAAATLEVHKPGFLVPLGILPPSDNETDRSPLLWSSYGIIMDAFFSSVKCDIKIVREVLRRYLQNRAEWEQDPDWWLAERGVLLGLVNGLARKPENIPLALNITQYYLSRQHTYAERLTSATLWRVLIQEYANQGDFENAEKCISILLRLGGWPGPFYWGVLFCKYIQAGLYNEAGRTFGAMLTSGLHRPHNRVYKEIALGHMNFDQVIQGLDEFFQEANGVYPYNIGVDVDANYKYWRNYLVSAGNGGEAGGMQEAEEGGEDELELNGLYEAYLQNSNTEDDNLKSASNPEERSGMSREGEVALAELEQELSRDEIVEERGRKARNQSNGGSESWHSRRNEWE